MAPMRLLRTGSAEMLKAMAKAEAMAEAMAKAKAMAEAMAKLTSEIVKWMYLLFWFIILLVLGRYTILLWWQILLLWWQISWYDLLQFFLIVSLFSFVGLKRTIVAMIKIIVAINIITLLGIPKLDPQFFAMILLCVCI